VPDVQDVPDDSATLDRRSLGRALLARQHLLARHDGTAVTEAAHLVGLQAQAPWAPYTGLWTRLSGFTHTDLADRLLDRSLVRVVAMRGTIHLLTADDALVLPTLCEPVLHASLRGAGAYGPALRDVDLDRLRSTARDLLEAEPATPATLGGLLGEHWPDVDPTALAYAARCLLPLVQVPPRAVWGRSGATRWTTTRAWLGREPVDLSDPEAHAAALDDLVLRYLAAFGPATAADVQTWSGLPRLGPVLERLRPRLITSRAEPAGRARRGRELFDLPDAPRPDPGTPAPVRLLPEYDNLLLSHADRTRVTDDDARRRMWRPNGAVPGALLVDGVVAGSWRVTRAGRSATVTVEPFQALPGHQRADVRDEAERLVRFVADDASDHAVVWHPGSDVVGGADRGLRSVHDPRG
jgi:hypothetical protein